jgi:beta-xylosidase
MLEWWVWSSEDLIDWTHEGTLSPTVFGFPEGYHRCWATDALSGNGKYYWYVCNPDESFVAVSDSPAGPWTSPLGDKPLMSGRDPAPFIDDDGTPYLVTGVWTYHIARLGDDMISLAERPRAIEIINPRGPYSRDGKNTGRPTDDKAYLHKRNDWYYLSWGCYYAMSRNVYGPYDCKGSFLAPETTAPELSQGGRWDYERHGSFFEWRGQWYFICNDLSRHGRFFRNSAIGYVHYRENGEIAPVRMTVKGVRAAGLPDEDFEGMR